jgi:hypothetical protein
MRLKAVRFALCSFRWGLKSWANIIGNQVFAARIASDGWKSSCDLLINGSDRSFDIDDEPGVFKDELVQHKAVLKSVHKISRIVTELLDKAEDGSLVPIVRDKSLLSVMNAKVFQDELFTQRQDDDEEEVLAGPQLTARRAQFLTGEANCLSVDWENFDSEDLKFLNGELEAARLGLAGVDFRRVKNELKETRMMVNTEGLTMALANMARFAVVLLRAMEELDRPDEVLSHDVV